jgi:hypothetical protein
LGNRWSLSIRITKGNTNTLELPQIGWRASKNLYPSRSKAPRVVDPPSLLGLFQVLKFKREREIFSQTHFKNLLSINARQGFGRE